MSQIELLRILYSINNELENFEMKDLKQDNVHFESAMRQLHYLMDIVEASAAPNADSAGDETLEQFKDNENKKGYI